MGNLRWSERKIPISPNLLFGDPLGCIAVLTDHFMRESLDKSTETRAEMIGTGELPL